jgi:hypothetical protein
MVENMSRAKNFFRKLGDKIGFDLPKIEITPEKEEEIINHFVQVAKQWGMEDLVILFGSGFAPMSGIFAYTVALPWAPVMGLAGIDNPWQYIAFFDNHENIKKIIFRLDEETRLRK